MLFSKYSYSWKWTTLSRIFEKTGSTEIGLWLSRFFASPPLKIGTHRATFHSEGTLDVDKDKLKSHCHPEFSAHRGEKNITQHSLLAERGRRGKINGEILSITGKGFENDGKYPH